jgi:hypothetical protein
VVPNAVPIECRFAANVQPGEPALEEPEAGVKIKRDVRPSEHTTGQAFEPPCANIVNGQVCRNAEGGQFLRGDWPSGPDLAIEGV